MEIIEFLMELFAGLVLLIGTGCLIGHLLKLDNFSDERKKVTDLHLRKTDTSMKEPGDLMQNSDF